MAIEKVVLLVGGVGGAKLAYGLAQILPPENLTVIVNTGDDFSLYGLYISPDLDTITYTLAGLVNKTFGWGVADDTTHALDALARYGEDTWFKLGDTDLATHLLRTKWMGDGLRLTEITRRITKALGIGATILPMTDSSVATVVDTVEYGELDFQVYFVRHRWQPTVQALRFAGVDEAQISDEVRAAIAEADAIILGPSNPYLSIAPILAVPGMQDAIRARDVPRVAVTPIVGGEAIKGPTAKLMRELGYNPTPQTVAKYYNDMINGFVYDQSDGELLFPSLRTTALDTVMRSDQDRIRLAQEVLTWMKGWD